MKNKYELLWNIGYSDECEVIILKRNDENLEFVKSIKAKGETIKFYINELLKLKFNYGANHLPQIAYEKSLNNKSVFDILKLNGFEVRPI